MDNTITIVSLTGSVLSCLAINKLLKNIMAQQSKLDIYLKTSVSSPSSLLAQYKSGLHRVPAFVMGILKSDYPVYSILKQYDGPLILSELRKYDLYSSSKIELVSKQRVAAPVFKVVGATDLTKTVMEVNQNLGVHAKHALDDIGFLKKTFNLNPIKYCLELILKIFRILLRLNKNNYKGFKVGEVQQELAIKMNQIFTLFGEVIIDADAQQLYMEQPSDIIIDKESLILKAKGKIRLNSITLSICVLIASLSAYICGKKLLIYIIKLIKARQRAMTDKLYNIKKLDISDFHCIICYDRARAVILKPCKHLSMCFECYNALPQKKCPICKSRITDYIELFIS